MPLRNPVLRRNCSFKLDVVTSLSKRALFTTIALLASIGVSFGCDLFSDSSEVEIVWTLPVTNPGAHFTQPLVEDGTAYVAYAHYLKAVDAREGTVLWSTDLRNGSNSLSSRKLLEDGDADGRLFLEHVDWVKAFSKKDGRGALASQP